MIFLKRDFLKLSGIWTESSSSISSKSSEISEKLFALTAQFYIELTHETYLVLQLMQEIFQLLQLSILVVIFIRPFPPFKVLPFALTLP